MGKLSHFRLQFDCCVLPYFSSQNKYRGIPCTAVFFSRQIPWTKFGVPPIPTRSPAHQQPQQAEGRAAAASGASTGAVPGGIHSSIDREPSDR